MNIPTDIPQIKKARKDKSLTLLKKWEDVWRAIHPDIRIYNNESQDFKKRLPFVCDRGLELNESDILRIVSYKDLFYYCFLSGDRCYATADIYTPDDEFFINNNLKSLLEEYRWSGIIKRIIQDIENTYLKVPKPPKQKASS